MTTVIKVMYVATVWNGNDFCRVGSPLTAKAAQEQRDATMEIAKLFNKRAGAVVIGPGAAKLRGVNEGFNAEVVKIIKTSKLRGVPTFKCERVFSSCDRRGVWHFENASRNRSAGKVA